GRPGGRAARAARLVRPRADRREPVPREHHPDGGCADVTILEKEPAVQVAASTPRRSLGHLDALEAEAVFVMREAAAELERPVLLFSGGKDSAVLLRLAEKAFRPGRFPFPVMHVDTGHNFPEALEFRDRRVAELGARLLIASVQQPTELGRGVAP